MIKDICHYSKVAIGLASSIFVAGCASTKTGAELVEQYPAADEMIDSAFPEPVWITLSRTSDGLTINPFSFDDAFAPFNHVRRYCETKGGALEYLPGNHQFLGWNPNKINDRIGRFGCKQGEAIAWVVDISITRLQTFKSSGTGFEMDVQLLSEPRLNSALAFSDSVIEDRKSRMIEDPRKENFRTHQAFIRQDAMPLRIGDRVCSMANQVGYAANYNNGVLTVNVVGEAPGLEPGLFFQFRDYSSHFRYTIVSKKIKDQRSNWARCINGFDTFA